jgi:hypothetical protein
VWSAAYEALEHNVARMRQAGTPGSTVSAPRAPQYAVAQAAADGKLVCEAKRNISIGLATAIGFNCIYRQASR